MNRNVKKLKMNIKGDVHGYRGHLYKWFSDKKIVEHNVKKSSVETVSNGHIEVTLEGEKERLWEILHWHKKGPLFCTVKEVRFQFSDSD